MDLRDLIISKVRVKLLQVLLSDPNEMYHVRDLVRRTKEEINAVRRELAHMEASGMVKKEARGNRLYYWARHDYPFYSDLCSMVAKTTGLGSKIIKARVKIGRLTFVLFSGKFVKRLERGEQEVDILVVGNVVMPELAAVVKEEEQARGQEINYTVMTSDEFSFRKSRKDPFLMGILSGPRVMIIGQEEDLVAQ